MAPSHSSSASAHLRLDGVSVSFPDRRVLTDISLVVSTGERVGLIGENGSGKSTLLRVAAGLLTPSAGTVTATAPGSGPPSIGLLHQQPPFGPSVTVAEALESSVAPARSAVSAIARWAQAVAETPDDAVAAEHYAQSLAEAERLGAWDVDTRIAQMLAGLGLRDLPGHRLTGELSGGQRTRLSLAWFLLRGPEILLLDEPTNHLDDDAVAHLRRVLTGWSGPVLTASHDRAFLDETVTSLVDLDPSPIPHAVANPLTEDGPDSGIGTTKFTGSYTDYLDVRAKARSRWEQQYREEQAELTRLRATVHDSQSVGHDDWRPRTEARIAQNFYADRNAKVVSRRVSDARRRLDNLEVSQIRKPPAELQFTGFTTARPSGSGHPADGPAVTATEIAVAQRLAPISLDVSGSQKWLITGPNGSGKSTLLQLLAGRLHPTEGHLSFRPGTRIGLLAQDTGIADSYQRGPARTVRQAYEDVVGMERAEQVPLSTFGLIAARDENRPLRSLSLGQQRRVDLAILLADPPDIIMFDEPTNHLSLTLSNALETAIGDYPGAVVIASHDRWLRARWQSHHLQLASVGDDSHPGRRRGDDVQPR